jgi:ferrous iron transport protein B
MRRPPRIALLGNPNTGKSTLYNRLCGLRTRTANFPGSTTEHQVGACALNAETDAEIIDLPGVYSLMLEIPESRLCRDCLEGRIADRRPDVALLVLDATNLIRNLQFAASALHREMPTVIAINMADVARRRGLSLDERAASRELGVPVIAISARTGEGIDRLREALALAAATEGPRHQPLRPLPRSEVGSREAVRWAADVFAEIASHGRGDADDTATLHDRLDEAFTHPIMGLFVFAATMAAMFGAIYWLAQYPMDAVDSLFAWIGTGVEAVMGPGALRELLVSGVIGGLAATLVFLPQIALLFFLLALLEDSGYLARAAFAVDRVMRRVGLPGQAFMPLLSAHACALPAIMSTRLIPNPRDRLATILVCPFMSCSARVPVYALLTSLLFVNAPLLAGLAFAGCYLLGALAAFVTAKMLRTTALRGPSTPMVLELPEYRLPSVRTALAVAWERALLFLRNAGTVILSIAIVMWWLSAYPKSEADPASDALRERAAVIASSAPDEAASLESEAARLDERKQQAGSFAGQLGSALEPIFAPMGLDRQLTVAVLTSFLAREVFTTTVFVLVGAGAEANGEDTSTLETVRTARRDDGTPLFTVPASAALLVFYVLAMQCLPTVVLVARETGSWRWALAQLSFMSILAYIAAFATYRMLA